MQTQSRQRHAGQRQVQVASLVERGLAAQRQGRHDEAVAALRHAAALQPNSGATHAHLGLSLLTLGQHEPAIAAYTRAAALLPARAAGEFGVHNNLGVAWRALDMPDKAAEAYRRAHALASEDPEICLNLGRALAACGQIAPARDTFTKAIARAPGSAVPWIHLGLTEQEFGETDAAMAAFDSALAIDPQSVSAWYCRSDLKTFTPNDPDLARMTALLSLADSPGRPGEDPIHLRFALGKAWLDVGEDDRAFALFHEANRRKRARFRYDAEADIDGMLALAGQFTAPLLQRMAGLGDPSETPVFVVGMPRSGSTLIEQILASHPQMAGIGETLMLGRRMARALAVLSSAAAPGTDSVASLAGDYVKAITAHAPGRLRVIDKELGHVRYVGLIHLMLPNARIIQCRRDPMDTCLSCYTRHFGGHQPFAYDQTELGRYHRGVDALMAHWRQVIPPDRLIDIAYEDVVRDLPGMARRLVAFCGLDWDDACLRFHETRRAIRTTSMQQARKPLYASSVGRWQRYRAHLGPLLAALEPPL